MHFRQNSFMGVRSQIEIPELFLFDAPRLEHFIMEPHPVRAAWPINGKRAVEVVDNHMER